MVKEIIFESHDECPICCASMKDETVFVTSCGHHFHKDCLLKQFNMCGPNALLCAICRTDLLNTLPEEIKSNISRSHIQTTNSPTRWRQTSFDIYSVSDVWGSDLVNMIIQMPQHPRGSRRTQLLLTRFVLAEEQNGRNIHLTPEDRDNLNRLQQEGQEALGAEDSERIAEFVNLANTVNQNFRDGSRSRGVSILHSGIPTFRDLSDFLTDSTHESHVTVSSNSYTFTDLGSRMRSLWNSLFGYTATRGRDNVQSPMRQSQIDNTLIQGVPRARDLRPWYHFGC